MKSKRPTLLAATIGLAVLMPVSCGDGTGPKSDVNIPQTTHVIPASDFIANLEVVSSDSATFVMKHGNALIDRLGSGDVLVSEAGPGFLRRILSTSDSAGYRVLKTAQANLTEAIEKGSATVTATVSQQASGMSVLYQAPGVRSTANVRPGTAGFYYELRDVVLYDRDGDPSTQLDRILANGTIEVTPSFTFAVVIDRRTLQTLTMSVTLEERSSLELGAGATLPLFDARKELLRVRSAPTVVFVGPVPIVITPIFSIDVGATGQLHASVVASVGQENTLTGGLSYQSGEWMPIANEQHSFSFTPPALSAGVQLKGYVAPQLTFLMYGVVGPYTKVSLYGLLDADVARSPWAILYGGIELGAGVRVQVFSVVIADYEDPEIIGFRVRLWESSATLGATLTANPTSGTAPFVTTLTATPTGTATGAANYTIWWHCTDPGTDVTAATASCGDPTSSTIGEKFNGVTANPPLVDHTYSMAGTYTAKVIVERGSAPAAESRTTVTVSLPLEAPSNLVATAVSTSEIGLTWQDNSSNEDGFRIERCAGMGCTGFTEIATVGANVTSYPNTGLTAGTSFTYRVRAYSAERTSGYSNPATATTLSEMLTATLEGHPPSGTAPLTTTMTATASGTATGTLNYTFWWHCTDLGASVSTVTVSCGDPTNAAIGAKFDGVADNPRAVEHTYANAGIYTAKVIVERGSAPSAEARTEIVAALAPPVGRIAFYSSRDGNPEIYVMKTDGSDVVRLTNDAAFDRSPAWSTDATRIAFTSNRSGSFEIYAMNVDGSGLTQLTNTGTYNEQPTWSPDGTKIAFSSVDGTGVGGVYVMNADGSGRARLTETGSQDPSPAWSPDGTKIAFAAGPQAGTDIYAMNADGSGVTRLTTTSYQDNESAWSPDSRKIAFSRQHAYDGAFGMMVMNADGSGLTPIPNGGTHPSWSPDGTRIAFHAWDGTWWHVYVMNADGSNVTQLSTGAADGSSPAWGR